MSAGWSCPKCRRKFTRVNQRHACGTGDVRDVVRDRPATVVIVYRALEQYAKSLGEVEVVARERYVLFRTTRIFTDLQIMSDCVRAAIHLPEAVEHPLFFKVLAGPRFVTHVAKLHSNAELDEIKPYLRLAYDHAARSAQR